MRNSLDTLMTQTVGLQYTLPNVNASIPRITISTKSDECYRVLTADDDLARVIYNGIIDYSYEESRIDLNRLDVIQKRALKQSLKFDESETEDRQLNYGFYGEVLLFLMLQKFYNLDTVISRGHFYNPLNNTETTGYDTYQMVQKSDGCVELWFGEVKFHKSFRTGVRQILNKISHSLSDDYFGTNIIAMEDYETFLNTDAGISPILDAFRNDPDVNLAQIAHEHGMAFVYPMLVVFNDDNESYDEIIKKVVNYTNRHYSTLPILFSVPYSIFFMFLPVKAVKDVKKLVRSWILTGQSVI